MKKTMSIPTEEKRVPDDETLKRLAQLPEDVKRMALAYAQGVARGRKLSQSA